MSGVSSISQLPLQDWIGLVVLPGIWVVCLIPFTIINLVYGARRTARMDKLPKNKLIPRYILEYGYWMMNLPVRAMVALGITADMVTMASLLVAVGSSILCGYGEFVLGGWAMFLAFALDGMDGMVARLAGTSSDRGEFFDAVIDRYADLFCYFGFAWYYRHDYLPLALVAASAIGSSVMSYAKAKGESVGIDPNVGYMQRHERGVILAAATVLSPFLDVFVEPGATYQRHWMVIGVLGLVALLTNITAIWRTGYVMRRMKKPAKPVAAVAKKDSEAKLLTDEQAA
jgi:CDP-diacylglycerol--glycerol-3-phosphate 3-phosphatidyltransferase